MDDVITPSSASSRPMNDCPDHIEHSFPENITYSELAGLVSNFMTNGYNVTVEYNPNVIQANRKSKHESGVPIKPETVHAVITSTNGTKVHKKKTKKIKGKKITIIGPASESEVERPLLKRCKTGEGLNGVPTYSSDAKWHTVSNGVTDAEASKDWQTNPFLLRVEVEAENKRHQEAILGLLTKACHLPPLN